MTALCGDCRAARDRWVHDSGHLIRPLGIRISSNASSDDTVSGVARNRKRRVDDYYALVRRQVALIHDICARKHQVAPGIDPLPAPTAGGQYDLLGVAS